MESEEARRVQARASEYEERLRRMAQGTELGELDAGEFPPVPSTPASRRTELGVTGPRPAVADAVSALSERETVLARRIRDDIARTLERAAREKNLSLTFSKRRRNPDYTAYFYNLLAEPARFGSVLIGST